MVVFVLSLSCELLKSIHFWLSLSILETLLNKHCNGQTDTFLPKTFTNDTRYIILRKKISIA